MEVYSCALCLLCGPSYIPGIGTLVLFQYIQVGYFYVPVVYYASGAPMGCFLCLVGTIIDTLLANLLYLCLFSYSIEHQRQEPHYCSCYPVILYFLNNISLFVAALYSPASSHILEPFMRCSNMYLRW